MKTSVLLLLVVFAALAESNSGNERLAKRELLVRSKRRWVLSTIELTEEDPGPYPKIISQMFNDRTENAGKNHKYVISGMGVTEDPVGIFRINEQTGVVEALKPIDREQYSLFRIKFDILNRETNLPIDRELAFDVEIKDINDNPPKFIKQLINANVMENMPEGYLPGTLQVIDLDQKNNSNSLVTMIMVSQTPAEPKIGLKQMDDRMAQLTFTGCFNYDKIKKYEVIVQAHDHGTPRLSSTAVINLNIMDSNSHPPMFKKKEYKAEVQESTTKNDVLRVAVEDKDTPNSPGWRAKYFFIQGNEEGNYKIETDPKTNEGVLSIIKGKDFERTMLTNVVIGVKNEEPLYVCKDNSPATSPFTDSVNVTIKVIDVNDPPQFEKENVDIYRKEEEPPGKELFTPKVTDVDSDISKIRYVLLKDPANWVTIDKKTGKVTSAKKMDRESPFVNGSNVYQVVIGAVDDGEPPATGTCTVKIHLGDINDNVPKLSNNSLTMCVNKGNKVRLSAKDADSHPFSGPFSFSLGSQDRSLAERWKLEPAYGEEASLLSLKSIPYGNYLVPLTIQDQQNVAGHDIVEMTVCECGDGDVCRGKQPLSVNAGPALLGLILASLLLFLLLVLVIKCTCGNQFHSIPLPQTEGSQSLMKYNYEGGGATCMAEPTVLLSQLRARDVTDFQQNSMKTILGPSAVTQETIMHSSEFSTMNRNSYSLGAQGYTDTYRSGRGQSLHGNTWNSNWVNTYQSGLSQGASPWYQHSSDLSNYIDKRVKKVLDEDMVEFQPREYAYEGKGSKYVELDDMSIKNSQDNLQFLDHLGPKFNLLGGICQETITEKKMQH